MPVFTEASFADPVSTPSQERNRVSGRSKSHRYPAICGSSKWGRAFFGLALSMLLLSGCSTTAPRVTPKPAPRAAAHPPLLQYALSFQGVPYRWGGTSPVRGFDCSGYVQYVFRRFGVTLPRTARQMAGYLPKVSKSSRRPGDLIFFQTTRQPYSHVGIYLGNNSFVHASKGHGKGVQISDLRAPFWRRHWQSVGRPRSTRSIYAETESSTLED